MPRERKHSSTDDSDGGSSSGDETSGSDSSSSDNSDRDHKRSTKKDSSARSKGDESTPGRSKQDEHPSGDSDKERRKGKAVSDSGELSSSDGEHVPRSGPRSTVVQKMTTSPKDKGKKREEAEKTSPRDDDGKDKSKDKREDVDHSRSKKRSHSASPRNRSGDKRLKEDRSHDRGSDRRDDRRTRRDDRDSERDRSRRRDSDRRRGDGRRRDDDRRDRSHHDTGRDRYDRRRDRDGERREDRRSERDGGDRRRDRDDRDKDRVDARREENKENKKDDNESLKRKGGEVDGEKEKTESAPPQKKTKDLDDIMTRTGGAYIPPARLRMMQAQITDKSSVPYQRMAWEALKKSINGLINKVNVSNIIDIVRELFQENIVRGRGLLARSVIQAQAASPTFTHVYSALVAIINTKFPQIGELILQRLILQFKRGFRRNDKALCLSSTRFVAHLVNQQVAHEVVSLEILTLLLENSTEDSVEVAIGFLKECGQKLTEVSPRGINAIFERLRSILHEAQLDKRVQYMVEVMFAIRKDGFKAHPAVISDLDLVEEDDQFTHLLQLDDVTTGQDQLNVFKADDDYLENEEKYKELKKEILDEGSSDEGGSGEESGSGDSSDDDDDDDEKEDGKTDIIDQTETNMVALRRTIYLTIQSSLDFEECAHKLLKMEFKPGQEVELCYMIIDCCAQLRTYEKFYGLLAQRFCQLDKKYMEPFQNIFREQFETIHRLETNKLRNVAKFFAHLLHTDAISWGVMSCMKLTEEDTTSASRIFIKILFLELSEYLGLPKLNGRLRDPTLQEFFEGILPRNNPKDTRFAINFFTTIGLGGLTEDLREHLKGISKQLLQQKQQQEQQLQQQQKEASSSSSDSSDSDSSDSDSSDSSSGSSDSSDSDSDDSDSSSDSAAGRKKKRRKSQKASSKTKGARKGKPPQSREERRTERHGERAEGQRPDSGQRVNGRGSEGRPRIEDKLLKLSLPKGMTLVDPPDLRRSHSSRPERRGKKGRDKQKKKQARQSRRLSHLEGRAGQRRRNSDRDPRGSSSFEQGSDRDQADRAFYRADREEMARGLAGSPPGLGGRPGRPSDGYEAMLDRRGGGRRDLSPVGRRDGPPDDYPPRRSDRREPEPDPSPPPHALDRHPRASPPLRRGDYDSPPPPPRRADRMDMDLGPRGVYDRRDLDDLPRQLDRHDLDSPPRYENSRDLDSPPHGVRMRDPLTPPPRMMRREMESPPRRLDSPSRRVGRGADLDRSLDRGRGDVDRNQRGGGDLDRGGRGEPDRGMDRSRGDGERGRVDLDRSRDELDRGRAMDRGRDRSGGRVELDSPRSDRRDMGRSPPVTSRREMNHGEVVRDGDRRRGGMEGYRDMDGRGGGRSLSPPPRKDKGRVRNEEVVHRRRSMSRDMDDRRKASSRSEREVSRERGRDKRRR